MDTLIISLKDLDGNTATIASCNHVHTVKSHLLHGTVHTEYTTTLPLQRLYKKFTADGYIITGTSLIKSEPQAACSHESMKWSPTK